MNHDDALIAEKLFGWVWLERESDNFRGTRLKCLFPPEDDPDFERVNYAPESWIPAHKDTKPFSDWYRGGVSRDRKKSGQPVQFLPAYTTDPAADYLVLCKLRETWNADMQLRFHLAVCKECHIQPDLDYVNGAVVGMVCDNFSPGIFSRAALSVLKEQG